MREHWHRKNLLSVSFPLLCCHVSNLFLMLMSYVFTVITTSWLRYSRQLEGTLLNVIARSVMLLRDKSVSKHNLRWEGDVCLDLVKKSHQNTSLLLLEISQSCTQDQNLDLWNRKLHVLETVFIRKASWLHNIELWNLLQDFNIIPISLKVLLLQLPSHLCFWCHYKCFLGSDPTEKRQPLPPQRANQAFLIFQFS